MAASDPEVEALERVLNRLAMTDDSNLEGILDKLLPLVLAKLVNGVTGGVQKAVLAILSHVNKRLKALPDITLPLDNLVKLYIDPSTGGMARNFALVYTEMAAARVSPDALFAQLNALVTGVSTRPLQHQDIILRLALQATDRCADQVNAFSLGTEDDFSKPYTFLSKDGTGSAAADRKAWLDFATSLMLYQPRSSNSGSRPTSARAQGLASLGGSSNQPPAGFQVLPLIQHNQQQRPAPMDIDTEGAEESQPPPPGLSKNDIARIEGKSPPENPALQRRKLGILNFTAAAGIDPSEVLQLYFAAACDPNETVSRRGDELVKKRCAVDTTKPEVDIESEKVIQPLFIMFLGTLDDPAIDQPARRSPVGPALRSRLLSLFCRSIAAANCFPMNLTTITTCLYGQGTTPRLKQQAMEFSVWTFKHADPAQLAPAAPAVLESCLSLLGDPGSVSNTALDANTLSMRSFAYQAVGHLAQRQPACISHRTDVPQRFFQALASEPPGVRASVQEAISALATAFTGCVGDTADEILQLLTASLTSSQEAVRAAAVQWAVRVFPFSNIPARYLCIVAAGDSRFQIADSGLAGLQPSKFKGRADNTVKKKFYTLAGGENGGKVVAPKTGDATLPDYPDVRDVFEYLIQRHGTLKTPVEEGRSLPMAPKSFLAAIEFTLGCWHQQQLLLQGGQGTDSGGGNQNSSINEEYLVFLENALVRDAPSELHASALAAMLTVAASDTTTFGTAYAQRASLFLRLSSHIDSTARDAAGRMLGMLCLRYDSTHAIKLLDTLTSTLRSTHTDDGRKVRFEEADGAAAALGYVAAHCLSKSPDVPETHVVSALDELNYQVKEASDMSLKSTAALSLGYATIPFTSSNMNANDSLQHQQPLASLYDVSSCLSDVVTLAEDKESKISKKAVRALGLFSFGRRGDPAVLQAVADGLLKLKGVKNDDVVFTIGEALCLAYGGVGVTGSDVLHSDFQSLAKWQQNQEQKQRNSDVSPSRETPQPMDIATSTTTPAANGISEIRTKILEALLTGPAPFVSASRPEDRKCGAAWLVALLTFIKTPQDLATLTPLLPAIQDALCVLLGDQDEITQDVAARGLSACYELADESTRQALVESLVGTLAGGSTRKRRAGDITADTQLFEPGTLGTVPGGEGSGGGGLSTYKEICALANDVGQPDLVYKFMQLANHQAALDASRGAAFGFASIAKLAGEQLEPHVGKLVPRLYRSLYDPQPKVRDAMHHIWAALFPDPNLTLTAQFDPLMSSLLKDTASSQWRVRESAALAAADLLQGRKWDALAPHFGELWQAVFRVMDDVKETVRLSGVALSRSVRGLTLRLADSETTPASEGRAAVAAALPVLLEKGLPSRVGEIQALAIDTTAKLVSSGGSEVLKPHLVVLVPAMLEALSGLEDSRLNYVEQHAERVGLDTKRLEAVRVNASQGGPIGSTLNACIRCLDATSLAEITPKLSGIIKRGVGLNTRAGAGRFVSQVARRMGNDASKSAPTLMRALREAVVTENSSTVRKAYASAHGNLARCIDPTKLDKPIDAWVEAGKGEGSSNSNSDRAIAGLMLKALGREAPDVFSRHTASIAPVAYVAQFDTDADVAKVWGEVWEETCSSSGAGLRMHAPAVAELIVVSGLRSSQWGAKRAAAGAAERAAIDAGDALGDQGIVLMRALLAELPGRLWEGKESVLKAIGAVSRACAVGLKGQTSDDLTGQIVAGLVEAARKKKSVYRKSGLEQLEIALTAFNDERHFATVYPLAKEICESFILAMNGPTSMDGIQQQNDSNNNGTTTETMSTSIFQQQDSAKDKDDSTTIASESSNIPAAEALACLVAAYDACGTQLASQKADDVAQLIAGVLAVAGKAALQLAVLQTAVRFAKKITSTANADIDLSGATSNLGLIALVEGAIKIASEHKAAQLRELALEILSGGFLEKLWGSLSDETKVKVRAGVDEVIERERLPGLKSQSQLLVTKLV